MVTVGMLAVDCRQGTSRPALSTALAAKVPSRFVKAPEVSLLSDAR